MDKRKQDLFAFARMTPAEYRDDLQQLRIFNDEVDRGAHPEELFDPAWEQRRLDRLELHKPRMASLDDSD